MRGSEFLDLAQEIVRGGTEVHWRGAAGRAYYALMLESRDALLGWGFAAPPRENIHAFVRLRFTFPASPDVLLIGRALDKLNRLRNKADYHLSIGPPFDSDVITTEALQAAADSITLLGAIQADNAR